MTQGEVAFRALASLALFLIGAIIIASISVELAIGVILVVMAFVLEYRTHFRMMRGK